METIKNTVSHVLGSSKSSNPETTTDSTVGHNTGTTPTSGTTGTTGYDAGSTTATTDTTGASAPTVHDQTTSETGNTVSHGTTGPSTTTGGDTSFGRDTTTTTGTADRTGAFSEHSGARDATLGADTTGTTTDTAGTSTDPAGTTSATTSSSDIARGRDTTTGDSSDSHHKHHDPHEIQSPSQGPDPALVGDAKEHPKLTGQGVPGSHSAVFGLTPDGKKYTEASHGSTPVKPAHSDETALGKKSVSGASGADSAGDTVSGGHGGVSDQIDAPDQGKKGLERTDPVPQSDAQSGGKPGAGLTGLNQGSGKV